MIWGSGEKKKGGWVGWFTLCIVYWYLVQFFNTLYLQQYLCIFYEVIKWITLLTYFCLGFFFFFLSRGPLPITSQHQMPKFSTTTHARKSEHFAAFCLMLPRSAEPLMMEWNNGVPDLPRWEMARYHCDIIHATYISNTLWRFVDARSVVLTAQGWRERARRASGGASTAG